jgi:hypothetical protein
MDFERVIRILGEYFQAGGAAWGIIGGLAMAAHGAARTTLDVDIVVDGESQDGLVEFLESLGFETLHLSTGYSNHLHGDPALGRVDVVYVRGESSRRIFAGVRSHPGPGGMQIPVPRAEHLAAMKAYSIKNDPTRTLRELADIRLLLETQGVDRKEIEGYFESYGLEDLLDRIDEN